jgi:hypothetical protein
MEKSLAEQATKLAYIKAPLFSSIQHDPSNTQVRLTRSPSAAKTLAAASSESHAQYNPSNALTHLIHASDAIKVTPFHAPKPTAAAAVPKQKPTTPERQISIPLLDHSQVHLKDTNFNVHPISKEEAAQQQHTKNYRLRNYHGQHAIAVPTKQLNKIKEDEDITDPMDYHNHR